MDRFDLSVSVNSENKTEQEKNQATNNNKQKPNNTFC